MRLMPVQRLIDIVAPHHQRPAVAHRLQHEFHPWHFAGRHQQIEVARGPLARDGQAHAMQGGSLQRQCRDALAPRRGVDAVEQCLDP